MIVPDQIGFSKSSKPTGYQFTFQELAQNTKAVLDALQIDKTFLLGHSMGGMLATRLATQYRAITERVVIYNAIGLVDGRFTRPWEGTDEP